MRRQVPRDSPSSTREFGPIEATMRDCRLASDRITTQWREYERTHDDRRVCADAVAVDFRDGDACGTVGCATDCCAGIAAGAGLGAASLMTPAATPLSRTTLSGDTLATTIRGAVVSVVAGADATGVFGRACPTSGGVLLRTTHIPPTITTSAATPTPLQICGAIGARSGLVPHHRHSPADSG